MGSIANNLRHFQRRLLDSLVRRHFHEALEKRAESIVRLFEDQLPQGSRILDLGGGWGFYSEPLATRGHETLVLDVVKPGYQKAPVVIYEGDKVPFDDKSFDVTTMVTMLHHVPDPDALVREVRRVTRKKIVVVEDLYHHPAGRFWTICRDRMLNMEFLNHPHQFRKHGEWLEFFKKYGFGLVKFQKFYTWLAGFRILNGMYVFEVA